MMRSRVHAIRCCLAAIAMLAVAACTEHIQEPWVNEGQKSLLKGERTLDAETRARLRDRMLAVQAQR